jgi:hypothetical protein
MVGMGVDGWSMAKDLQRIIAKFGRSESIASHTTRKISWLGGGRSSVVRQDRPICKPPLPLTAAELTLHPFSRLVRSVVGAHMHINWRVVIPQLLEAEKAAKTRSLGCAHYCPFSCPLCPLLPIVAHYCPLLPISTHYRPLWRITLSFPRPLFGRFFGFFLEPSNRQ